MSAPQSGSGGAMDADVSSLATMVDDLDMGMIAPPGDDGLDLDFALEDLGDLLVPINASGSNANDAPGSFIGYLDDAVLPLPSFAEDGTNHVGAEAPLAAAPQLLGHGVATTTTNKKRAPATVASYSAMAQLQRPPVKRARTRYTARTTQPISAGDSAVANSQGTSSATAPVATVVVPERGRKVRKNNRERQRRMEVNANFAELADLLQVERKTKSEKVPVLHAAIDEIKRLRTEVASLRAALSTRNESPMGSDAQHHTTAGGTAVAVNRHPQATQPAQPLDLETTPAVAAAAAASFEMLMREQLLDAERRQHAGATAQPPPLQAAKAATAVLPTVPPLATSGVGSGTVDAAAAQLDDDVNMFERVFA